LKAEPLHPLGHRGGRCGTGGHRVDPAEPRHIEGFVVLPRHRVVERTFSWFGRDRRLAKGFKDLAETLPTFITLPLSSWPSGGLFGSSPNLDKPRSR
jgi:hypothetical protein